MRKFDSSRDLYPPLLERNTRLLFSKVYNAVFEVDEAIAPGTYTGYLEWFGEEKPNLERFFVVFILNKFINQGRFEGPGKYHLQVYRKWWSPRSHAHLAKFPVDATEESIVQFYDVLFNLEQNHTKEKDNG